MTRGVLVMVAAALCAAPAAAKVRVVTSIGTLAAITRSVGGERVAVEALVTGRHDPHAGSPRPALAARLAQADLVIYAGLDLEAAWLPRLIEQARNPRLRARTGGVLDCSQAIRPVDLPAPGKLPHLRGQHPRGNPHYWLPPEHALRVAQLVAERLRVLDPRGAATYRARLQRFRDEVTRRQPGWLAAARPLKGRTLVTYHRGWTYVVAWLGMVELATVEPAPGTAPSLRQLAELAVTMKRAEVRSIVAAPHHAGATAALAARLAGARLIVVPDDVGGTPAARDYPSLVDAVIAGLRQAAQEPSARSPAARHGAPSISPAPERDAGGPGSREHGQRGHHREQQHRDQRDPGQHAREHGAPVAVGILTGFPVVAEMVEVVSHDEYLQPRKTSRGDSPTTPSQCKDRSVDATGARGPCVLTAALQRGRTAPVRALIPRRDEAVGRRVMACGPSAWPRMDEPAAMRHAMIAAAAARRLRPDRYVS